MTIPAAVFTRSVIRAATHIARRRSPAIGVRTARTARPPPSVLAPKGPMRTMVTVTQTNVSDTSDTSAAAAALEVAVSRSQAIDKDAEEIDTEGIVVTASCAARINDLATQRPDADSVYLRVWVDAGGCSGFEYKFDLESEASDDEDQRIDPDEDVVFERDGARVVVDRASLDLMRGSTVDFVTEMIRSSFAVMGNPQSESACGCGSSFAVKNFEENPAMD